MKIKTFARGNSFLINYVFIFLLSFVNICCEKVAVISYRISNKSSQIIKIVFFNTDNYDKATYNKKDSAFVDVNSEKLIVIQNKGLSRVSKYKETETHLLEFKYFEVYQQNIKSKTDFSLSSNWNYVQQDAHSASYTCTVNQSDF